MICIRKKGIHPGSLNGNIGKDYHLTVHAYGEDDLKITSTCDNIADVYHSIRRITRSRLIRTHWKSEADPRKSPQDAQIHPAGHA